jgi:hypothetical protein
VQGRRFRKLFSIDYLSKILYKNLKKYNKIHFEP